MTRFSSILRCSWLEDERALGANFEKLPVFTHRKEFSLVAAVVFLSIQPLFPIEAWNVNSIL